MVLGRLATSCCRRVSLPPDGWWPLAVAGGIKDMCSDMQVYYGDLCNYESYSSLKSLLCVSTAITALECEEIV